MNSFTGMSKILRHYLEKTHKSEMMNAFRQFAGLCATVVALLLQPVLWGSATLLFHGDVYTGNPNGLSVQVWLLQEPALTPPLSRPIVALIFSGGTPLA
jgi:hypothetical protein